MYLLAIQIGLACVLAEMDFKFDTAAKDEMWYLSPKYNFDLQSFGIPI